MRLLRDERYLCIDGKPYIQIYKPQDIPDVADFIMAARNFFSKSGAGEVHFSCQVKTPLSDWSFLDVFDSAVLGNPTACLFAPDDIMAPVTAMKFAISPSYYMRSLPVWIKRILYRIEDWLPDSPSFFCFNQSLAKLVRQYNTLRERLSIPVYPTVYVGFDNTPRYGKRAKVVTDVSYAAYSECVSYLSSVIGNEHPIFINAWNEWGEGMALEALIDYGEFPERSPCGFFTRVQ